MIMKKIMFYKEIKFVLLIHQSLKQVFLEEKKVKII